MWKRLYANMHFWLRSKQNITLGNVELTTPEFTFSDYWNFEHFRLPPIRRDEEEAQKWSVVTDSVIGGFSKATFAYDIDYLLETTDRQKELIRQYYFIPSRKNESSSDIKEEEKKNIEQIALQTKGCAHFSGNLSLTLPTSADKSGFASIKGPVAKVINLSSYDGLELRIKTDGRLYLAQIKLDSDNNMFVSRSEEELYQIIIPPIPPNTWTTVLLPFSDFILTWRGYQRDQDELMDTSIIKSLSFLMAERSEGDFSFHIDWVHAVKFDGTDRFLPFRYKGEFCSIQPKFELEEASKIIASERRKIKKRE